MHLLKTLETYLDAKKPAYSSGNNFAPYFQGTSEALLIGGAQLRRKDITTY